MARSTHQLRRTAGHQATYDIGERVLRREDFQRQVAASVGVDDGLWHLLFNHIIIYLLYGLWHLLFNHIIIYLLYGLWHLLFNHIIIYLLYMRPIGRLL